MSDPTPTGFPATPAGEFRELEPAGENIRILDLLQNHRRLEAGVTQVAVRAPDGRLLWCLVLAEGAEGDQLRAVAQSLTEAPGAQFTSLLLFKALEEAVSVFRLEAAVNSPQQWFCMELIREALKMARQRHEPAQPEPLPSGGWWDLGKFASEGPSPESEARDE